MFRILSAVFALSLGLATACYAQSGPDPIRDSLTPPDVVMSHADALGLSEAQKKAILADVTSAQSVFSGQQQKLQDAVTRFGAVLHGTRVDEAQAMTQLDEVLKLERDVKRTQLTLMIRVKNELTAAQQAQVRQYMAAAK